MKRARLPWASPPLACMAAALGLTAPGCVLLAPVDDVVEDEAAPAEEPGPSKPTKPSPAADDDPAEPEPDDPAEPDPTDPEPEPEPGPAEPEPEPEPGPAGSEPDPTDPPAAQCALARETCSDEVPCCDTAATLCLSGQGDAPPVCTPYGCFGNESCEADEICHFDLLTGAQGELSGARLCVGAEAVTAYSGASPCGSDYDCQLGLCFNIGYCLTECYASADCGINLWSGVNDACIPVEGFALCVPYCNSDVDCAPYFGTTCVDGYTVEGDSVSICN